MRHGYPKGRYKNYFDLEFVDFEGLLLGKIVPGIDVEKTKEVLASRKLDFDFIICSAQRRGVETAQIVSDITGSGLEILSLLNEVSFTKGVICENDISDIGKLRKKILTQFYNSNYSETFFDAVKRLKLFIDYVKGLEYDNILCVTHGWFMRLIYLYSVGKLEDVSLKELLEANVPDFLDTIEIEI